jgi:cell division septum initiation protein DivIVA
MSGNAGMEAELRAIREELRQLKAQQEELAQAIAGLTQTFRHLAVQMGIAAEPYPKEKGESSARDRERPGFA